MAILSINQICLRIGLAHKREAAALARGDARGAKAALKRIEELESQLDALEGGEA